MPMFWIGIIAAIFAVIFAFQNAAPIAVGFLFWRFEASLALVLLLTFALGVAVSALISIPIVLKRRRSRREPPAA